MFADEHVKIATHENHHEDDGNAGQKPDPGGEIHQQPSRKRTCAGLAPAPTQPIQLALKGRLPNANDTLTKGVWILVVRIAALPWAHGPRPTLVKLSPDQQNAFSGILDSPAPVI